jgi:tetratricopeptide (TPR) repeat protein
MPSHLIRGIPLTTPFLISVLLCYSVHVKSFSVLRPSISHNRKAGQHQQKQHQQQQQHQHQLFATTASSESKSSGPPPSRDQKARRKTRILFQSAKQLEKQGKWREASDTYRSILQEDPHDSHSYLGYARLEARRSTNSTAARQAFQRGTAHCPESVHLWQAWALYEQSRGEQDRARDLFERALTLDERNPYVCHAYGLMEKKLGNGNVSGCSMDFVCLCAPRAETMRKTHIIMLHSLSLPLTNPCCYSSPNNYGNGPYWNDRRQLSCALLGNCSSPKINLRTHVNCTFAIYYPYPRNEK